MTKDGSDFLVNSGMPRTCSC